MAIDRYKPRYPTPYQPANMLTTQQYEDLANRIAKISHTAFSVNSAHQVMRLRTLQSVTAYAEVAAEVNVIRSRYGRLLTPYDHSVIDAYLQITAEANAALLQQVLQRVLDMATQAMYAQPAKKKSGWDEFLCGFTFGLYDPDRR